MHNKINPTTSITATDPFTLHGNGVACSINCLPQFFVCLKHASMLATPLWCPCRAGPIISGISKQSRTIYQFAADARPPAVYSQTFKQGGCQEFELEHAYRQRLESVQRCTVFLCRVSCGVIVLLTLLSRDLLMTSATYYYRIGPQHTHSSSCIFFLPMAWPWMIDHGGPIRQQRY